MTRLNLTSTSPASALLSIVLTGSWQSVTPSTGSPTMENSASFPRVLKNFETGAITHPLIPHRVQIERRRRELREKHGNDISTSLPPRPHTSRHSLSFRSEDALNEGKPFSTLRATSREEGDRVLQQQMGALYQGYGTHYVDLWVGTPIPQRQTVIVDTGSGVTAFPCMECTGCGDDYHTDGYFVQSESETFRALTCDECLRGYCASMNGNKKCRISMSYAEGSSWSAYESLDLCYAGGPHDQPLEQQNHPDKKNVDHIDPVDASQFAFDLAFGCQVSITGLFITQLADGIMGMENDKTSFWKQMFAKNAIPRPEFSLCFSRQDNADPEGTGAGAMTLGGVDTRLHMNPMVFTKNVKSSGFYTVHVKAVYLREDGGSSPQVTKSDMAKMHKLEISESALNSGNVIVDSGTTDTYFTSALQGPFKKAWKKITNKEYNHNAVALTKAQIEQLPTIIFVLQGYNGDAGDEPEGDPNDIPGYAGDSLSPANPKDVVLAVPASHYMEYDPDEKKYVARFYVEESNGSVLGANAMMGHDVFFDTGRERIGWAESSCDYASLLQSEGSVSVVPENVNNGKTSTKTEVPSNDEQSGASPPVDGGENGSSTISDKAATLLSDMQTSCSSATCRGIAFTCIFGAVVLVTIMIRRTMARRRVVRQYQEAELEISDLALDSDSDDETGYVDEPPIPRIS